MAPQCGEPRVSPSGPVIRRPALADGGSWRRRGQRRQRRVSRRRRRPDRPSVSRPSLRDRHGRGRPPERPPGWPTLPSPWAAPGATRGRPTGPSSSSSSCASRSTSSFSACCHGIKDRAPHTGRLRIGPVLLNSGPSAILVTCASVGEGDGHGGEELHVGDQRHAAAGRHDRGEPGPDGAPRSPTGSPWWTCRPAAG